jgi:hypothetical protein
MLAIASPLWLIGNDQRTFSFLCTDVAGTEIEGNLTLINRIINAHRHAYAIFFD